MRKSGAVFYVALKLFNKFYFTAVIVKKSTFYKQSIFSLLIAAFKKLGKICE